MTDGNSSCVQFKPVGKIYWFNPEPFELKTADFVVVDTIRELSCGK